MRLRPLAFLIDATPSSLRYDKLPVPSTSDNRPKPSSSAPAAAFELPWTRRTLKLQLSILITLLLALVSLAGGAFVIRKARADIRAEVLSTAALAGHFIDAQLALLAGHRSDEGYAAPLFQLSELGEVRHLSVQFYDSRGRLLDSNESASREQPMAPGWFSWLVFLTSKPLPPAMRDVSFGGVAAGRIVIKPDPTQEMEEIWQTSSGLLELLFLFFVSVNCVVWWAVSHAMRPVENILSALGQIQLGNLTVRLPRFALPEMSRISVGFNHMVGALERSVVENQRLTRQLLQVQESERNNLARELHDEIGQYVSAIHADAAAIRNSGDDAVRESAEAIAAATARMKDLVRGMLQRLRPPTLEALGLDAALRAFVAAFQQRNPQTVCSLRTSGEFADLDAEVGIAVYRVVQECMTNIAVHAHAQRVLIEVTREQRAAAHPARPSHVRPAGTLRLTIVDDGVGFSPASATAGLGLAGIRERVKVLGGNCHIESSSGAGTRITVDAPVVLIGEGAT
jgi:two-component system, NarL family, sensor histidine kinase UhpB